MKYTPIDLYKAQTFNRVGRFTGVEPWTQVITTHIDDDGEANQYTGYVCVTLAKKGLVEYNPLRHAKQMNALIVWLWRANFQVIIHEHKVKLYHPNYFSVIAEENTLNESIIVAISKLERNL